MQIVPLRPVPNQIVSVTLNDQSCQIQVTQKSTGLFVTLWVNNALVIGGVICETDNVIVRSAWLGFSGDLAFEDTQPTPAGPTDPFSDGIGSRFFLCYFPPAELPLGLS